MNRKIIFMVLLLVLLVAGIALWGLYLVLTRSSTPFPFSREIEGHIEIVDEQPYEGCWVFELVLTFKPKKGMAKGVQILLDLGELEIVGATPSF